MPICKNCGSRISKFDKDLCPICGEKHPIDPLQGDTLDVTSQIQLHPELEVKAKNRRTIFLLSLLLGFTGAQHFYLGYKLRGFVNIALYILILVGSFFGLNLFLNTLPVILLLIAILFVINIAQAIYFISNHNYKDSNGELIL